MNVQNETLISVSAEDAGTDFLSKALTQLGPVLLGRSDEIKLTLAAFLSEGHVMLDGLPGVGKTIFAEAIARVLGLQFSRVQFTSDLLPADLIGAAIFNQQTSKFTFHKGPIFTEILLVDEINRAGPKVQSALLEAMAEKQITHDGESHKLSRFFFTMATRNPGQQLGTFPLPEAQLDRFLFRLTLNYPDRNTELQLLQLGNRKGALDGIIPVLNQEEIAEIQNRVTGVTVREAIYEYVMDLMAASRDETKFVNGLSSRAGILLISAARSYAWLSGRDHVLPDDIQAVFPAVVDHRLVQLHERSDTVSSSKLLIELVPVP